MAAQQSNILNHRSFSEPRGMCRRSSKLEMRRPLGYWPNGREGMCNGALGGKLWSLLLLLGVGMGIVVGCSGTQDASRPTPQAATDVPQPLRQREQALDQQQPRAQEGRQRTEVQSQLEAMLAQDPALKAAAEKILRAPFDPLDHRHLRALRLIRSLMTRENYTLQQLNQVFDLMAQYLPEIEKIFQAQRKTLDLSTGEGFGEAMQWTVKLHNSGFNETQTAQLVENTVAFIKQGQKPFEAFETAQQTHRDMLLRGVAQYSGERMKEVLEIQKFLREVDKDLNQEKAFDLAVELREKIHEALRMEAFKSALKIAVPYRDRIYYKDLVYRQYIANTYNEGEAFSRLIPIMVRLEQEIKKIAEIQLTFEANRESHSFQSLIYWAERVVIFEKNGQAPDVTIKRLMTLFGLDRRHFAQTRFDKHPQADQFIKFLRGKIPLEELKADMRQAQAFSPSDVQQLLTTAKCRGCNLEGVSLEGKNLRGVELSEANLRGANLEKADLKGAKLGSADLRGASLEGADLRGVYLSGAKLSNAPGDDFPTKKLQAANLRGVNLEGADLRSVHMYEVNLQGANLRRANLASANLTKTDLSGANLEGANMHGALAQEADLQGARLRGADLEGADLREAKCEEADLRGANLIGVNLERANLRRAKLSRANLTRAQLLTADLEGADLSEATWLNGSLCARGSRGDCH